MELFGWHAIFMLMVAAVAVMLTVRFALVETVNGPSRIRPAALAGSYVRLVADPHFLTSSLVIAGSAGAIYTQATVLPFILIDRVGLSPTEFGAGMLMQCGSYSWGRCPAPTDGDGSVPSGWCPRPGVRRIGACARQPARISSNRAISTSWGRSAFYAFGIAFVMPAMQTASLAPFPHIAGAASSMTGLSRWAPGLSAERRGGPLRDTDPALATIVPAMGVMARMLIWRLLPERRRCRPNCVRSGRGSKDRGCSDDSVGVAVLADPRLRVLG